MNPVKCRLCKQTISGDAFPKHLADRHANILRDEYDFQKFEAKLKAEKDAKWKRIMYWVKTFIMLWILAWCSSWTGTIPC